MENYLRIEKEAQSLIDPQCTSIGNLANICSLLFHSVADLNWVGIYTFQNDKLYLGPFIGKPACTIIPISKGICGRAVREEKTTIVNDVTVEHDHIVCDSCSQSELVLILHRENKIWGVLDIDASMQNRFVDADLVNLFERIAKLIEEEILK